jgi:hypothetical protein
MLGKEVVIYDYVVRVFGSCSDSFFLSFRRVASRQICISNDSNGASKTCVSPENPYNTSTTDVTISIHFDDFPFETGWHIAQIEHDGEQGRILVNRPIGTYDHENETQEVIALSKGKDFLFVLEDASGDGISCCKHQGSYSLSMGDKLLVSGGAYFGARRESAFSVTL